MALTTSYALETLIGCPADDDFSDYEGEDFDPRVYLTEIEQQLTEEMERERLIRERMNELAKVKPLNFSPPPVSEVECSICCFPFDEDKFTLSCNHAFCTDCLRHYCKVQISERPTCLHIRHLVKRETERVMSVHRENKVGLLCPNFGCKAVIEDNTIRTKAFPPRRHLTCRLISRRQYVQQV